MLITASLFAALFPDAPKGEHYITRQGNFPWLDVARIRPPFKPPSLPKPAGISSLFLRAAAGRSCLRLRFSTLLVSMAGILSSACLTRQESAQPPRLPPPPTLARGDGKDIHISRSDGPSPRGAAAPLTHRGNFVEPCGRTLNTGFSNSSLYLHGTRPRAAPVTLTKHSEESLSGD